MRAGHPRPRSVAGRGSWRSLRRCQWGRARAGRHVRPRRISGVVVAAHAGRRGGRDAGPGWRLRDGGRVGVGHELPLRIGEAASPYGDDHPPQGGKPATSNLNGGRCVRAAAYREDSLCARNARAHILPMTGPSRCPLSEGWAHAGFARHSPATRWHASACRRRCFGDAKPVFSTARKAFDCVYICSGIVEVRSL